MVLLCRLAFLLCSNWELGVLDHLQTQHFQHEKDGVHQFINKHGKIHQPVIYLTLLDGALPCFANKNLGRFNSGCKSLKTARIPIHVNINGWFQIPKMTALQNVAPVLQCQLGWKSVCWKKHLENTCR